VLPVEKTEVGLEAGVEVRVMAALELVTVAKVDEPGVTVSVAEPRTTTLGHVKDPTFVMVEDG